MKKNKAEEVSQMPLSSSEAPFVDHSNEQQRADSSSSCSIRIIQVNTPVTTNVSIEATSPSLSSLSPSLLTWDEALYQACVQNQTFAKLRDKYCINTITSCVLVKIKFCCIHKRTLPSKLARNYRVYQRQPPVAIA